MKIFLLGFVALAILACAPIPDPEDGPIISSNIENYTVVEDKAALSIPCEPVGQLVLTANWTQEKFIGRWVSEHPEYLIVHTRNLEPKRDTPKYLVTYCER